MTTLNVNSTRRLIEPFVFVHYRTELKLAENVLLQLMSCNCSGHIWNSHCRGWRTHGTMGYLEKKGPLNMQKSQCSQISMVSYPDLMWFTVSNRGKVSIIETEFTTGSDAWVPLSNRIWGTHWSEVKERSKKKCRCAMINELNTSTFSWPKLANKAVTAEKSSSPTAANPPWFKDQTNWQCLGKSHC